MADYTWKNGGLLVFSGLIFILLSACAVKDVSRQSASQDMSCQQLWAESERRIHKEQVADSAVVRVQGFPYLRSNRFLEGLADRAADNQERHYVLEQMRLLDLDKRLLELSRIPGYSLAASPGAGEEAPVSLPEKLDRCSSQFLHQDQQRPGFFEEVRQGVDLDRDYSLWLRSVGLYPLTSLFVDYIAENAQEKMIATLNQPALAEAGEAFITFRPPQALPQSEPNLVERLRRSRTNPLLSLSLTDQDLFALAQEFAPLLTIDDGAGHDRFGRIARNQGEFEVKGSEPVVYYYFSQTFVQDIPALQINYVIWFSERTEPAPWFEQGNLDGIVFRVTLNWQGIPAFVDVAFLCGCYHFVLVNDELVSGKLIGAKGFQPFLGGTLPELNEGERLQFKSNR